MSHSTDDTLRELLAYDTIAVVGCSTTPGKAAHDVPAYLVDRGYEVLPVNPYADEVFGRKATDSLTALDEDVDLVCVFRPSEEVSGIVDEVLSREDVSALWLQRGITDDEAATRAKADGVAVVQDRCLKVEHRRLMG
ncbi:CoA-binding protein [Halobacteria archaeon AArc-dxtr1]|nr:CoA-binding protein [Halobacteria archaeon AArc-dxtr1]